MAYLVHLQSVRSSLHKRLMISVEIEYYHLAFCEMGRPLDGVTNCTQVFSQVTLSVLSEQVLPSTPFGSPGFLKASATGS
jgi:hypothetical protein